MQSVHSRRHTPDVSHGVPRHFRASCACAPTKSHHGNGSKKVTNTNLEASPADDSDGDGDGDGEGVERPAKTRVHACGDGKVDIRREWDVKLMHIVRHWKEKDCGIRRVKSRRREWEWEWEWEWRRDGSSREDEDGDRVGG